MTKAELIFQIGQRLGDTQQDFLDTILAPIFDRVLEELALNDCISQLKKQASFSLVADQRDYPTNLLTGLPTNSYPLDITKVLVPRWGVGAGNIYKVSEQQFDESLLTNTDDQGNPVTGQPKFFRLYPNETQLQVDPVPSAAYAVSAQATYIAPPSVLATDANIIELQPTSIPSLVAGMLWHGAPFQDESLPDRKTQRGEFELLMLRIKQHTRQEIGRTKRTLFRDF